MKQQPQTAKRIGRVEFMELTPDDSSYVYSDGDIEAQLLEHFKKGRSADSFLKANPSWASTYHLSPVRENLLNWVDFGKHKTVLEVGAGVGALTGLLSRRAGQVTALELTQTRALVNAYRHRRANNLQVVVGNLEQFAEHSQKQFDFVVCVGVLEYAGRFINSPAPFATFLNMLRAQLKPTGTLLLAIENKLGLKYLSGAKEDHVGRYLENIEGYPHYDGIATFGKRELLTMLSEAGFNYSDFYYPFPDYKLPHTLYSDNYLPGVHTADIPSSFFPTPTPDQSRLQIMREQLAVRSLAANGLYGDLANSFLVLARPHFSINKNRVAYARGPSNRPANTGLSTRIYGSLQGYRVGKRILNDQAKAHLAKLPINAGLLKTALKSSRIKVAPVIKTTSDEVDFKYIPGPSFETELLEALLTNDQPAALRLLDSFVAVVDSFPAKTLTPSNQAGFKKVFGAAYKTPYDSIKPGLLDLNFDNLVHAKNGYSLIDYEWLFPFYLPKNLVIGRAFYYFCARHSQIIRALTNSQNPSLELAPGLYVPKWLYEAYKKYWRELRKVVKSDTMFQTYVRGAAEPPTLHQRPQVLATELADNLADAYEASLGRVAELDQITHKLSQELQSIKASLGAGNLWRLQQLLRRLRRGVRSLPRYSRQNILTRGESKPPR